MSLQGSVVAAVQVFPFLFSEATRVPGHKKVPTLYTCYSIFVFLFFVFISLCFPTGSRWNFRNTLDYSLRIRRAFFFFLIIFKSGSLVLQNLPCSHR